MSNKNYNTHLSTYSEPEALQQLLEAADDVVSNERFAQHEDDAMNDEFTITIGGNQIAFYCGGPQLDALRSFVAHIADENMYDVDFSKATVKGWK